MGDWNWKLRLFASADLVGSTAYKSTSSADKPEWAATFKQFFRDFPLAVEREYSLVPDKCGTCQEHLRPWKFSGDEVLFWVELRSYRESIVHLAAFKQAVVSFSKLWLSEKKISLSLKATAWLAGFPVRVKIFLPRKKSLLIWPYYLQRWEIPGLIEPVPVTEIVFVPTFINSQKAHVVVSQKIGITNTWVRHGLFI